MRPGARGTAPNWVVGLLALILITIAMALAFLKDNLPWGGGYELRAAIADAQSIAKRSPVRIAGVNVGEVVGTEPMTASGQRPHAALVTMEISEAGRPIHTDATVHIRPRLFLEGNYFVELDPGTPTAPEAEEGFVIPITNTSSSVQLDQVLTTLQFDVRSHLRTALEGLGDGLVRHRGSDGLRTFLRSSPGANKPTARVAEALLGTEPGDLAGTVSNTRTVVAAMAENRAGLQGLITNLNAVSGALAAEAEALERSIAVLPATIDAARPALAALNGAFPELRAFAREALPGVRALPPALDAAIPLAHQLRRLLSSDELRGLVADLRPGISPLTRLTRRTEGFLRQARALSSCVNETVVPWANETIPDPETPATGRLFEEATYALSGVAGESRSGDANGPVARELVGGGANTVVMQPFLGTSDEIVGITPLELLGARPSLSSSAKTAFRPDVACETNDPPDLGAGPAAPPPQQRPLAAPPGALDPTPALRTEISAIARRLRGAGQLARHDHPGAARAETAAAIKRLNRVLAASLGWQALLRGGGR